jgi:hypothetical protein
VAPIGIALHERHLLQDLYQFDHAITQRIELSGISDAE